MKSKRLLSALVALILVASFWPASAAPVATPPVREPAAPNATSTLPDPFSAGPDYDSGWRNIAAGETLTLTHNINGVANDMLVQLDTRKYNSAAGIGQRYIGGNDWGSRVVVPSSENDRVGAYWSNLSTNSIRVTRGHEDTLLDAVRVRIWTVAPATYWDSTWYAMSPGEQKSFTHNLGGNIDDYVVDMMFYDVAGGMGTNQRAYGGRTQGTRNALFNDGARVGAYWYGLQENVINVYRLPDDEYADQVLVRIWKRQKVTYDSGWVSLSAGAAHEFNHYIGGSPEDYRVDMEFKTPNVPWLVNQCFYGGNDVGPQTPWPSAADNDRVGAYWYGLDANSVTVFRRPEDACAPQVRIRIWNFWTPTRPDYDTGWTSVTQGGYASFATGITGGIDPFPYLIDLQFKDSGFLGIGINQRGLGRMDWTNGDRLGGSWSFKDGELSFFRMPEDADAPYMRARVWKMPRPAYDSGWQEMWSAGLFSLLLEHNLGGNPADYLVDVQFLGNSGNVHQAGYGGYDITRQDPYLGHRHGGYWDGLDGTHIEVHRLPEEDYSLNAVRVRIWTLSRPDYDFGPGCPHYDLHRPRPQPEWPAGGLFAQPGL